MEQNKKNNILFKDLNLVMVYAVVFAFGLLIIFLMTNYLNNKVNEFTNPSDYYAENQ